MQKREKVRFPCTEAIEAAAFSMGQSDLISFGGRLFFPLYFFFSVPKRQREGLKARLLLLSRILAAEIAKENGAIFVGK